jgi:hypothetical protein
MPLRRSMLTRMVRKNARRPQFVRIAKFFGLAAGQVCNPALGLRGDFWLPAGPRQIIERCHRTIGQRPLDAALGRLMVYPDARRTAKNDGSFR